MLNKIAGFEFRFQLFSPAAIAIFAIFLLFIFGGVAEMEQEPDNPRAEFVVAIAGPIASLVLAIVFVAVSSTLENLRVSFALYGVFGYLGLLNAVLAIFNLIPAFPLDGGRVLRSILWHWKRDLQWATRLSSKVGEVFGAILIAAGILSMFRGEIVGGMWFGLIGLYLRFAAAGSYYSMVSLRTLEGETIHRFMVPEPVTVPSSLTVKDLMEQVFLRYLHDLYPVVEGNHLIGSVGPQQVKSLPNERWSETTVAEIMVPVSETGIISHDEDATVALSMMRQPGRSRLMVLEDEKLVGIITLKDMLKFLSLKVQFEQTQLPEPSAAGRDQDGRHADGT